MSGESDAKRITRRDFLKTSAGMGLGLLVAACAPKVTAPTSEQSSTVAAPTVVQSVKLESELNLLSWGSYVDFALKPFEDKYQVKINAEYYGNEEEAMSKVKAAPGKYDIISLGVGWMEVAAKQGLLQPLDVSRIASYNDMYDTFKPGPFEVDGKTYGVIYAFGTNATMVNMDLIPGGIDTWEVFWDPKYKGKIALSDKSRDQYLVTMLRYGLDFNNPKDSDWDKIKQSIKDRAKNMRSIWTSEDEVKRMMISKEVELADSYDGLTFQITKEYPAVKYIIPKEGTYGWFDGPEILAGAPHPNLAYKWIEFITSPDMAKLVAENVYYAPGNSKVPSMLTPELRTQLNLDDPQKVLKGLRFWKLLGTDWDRKISDAWTEAKAEAGS